MPSARKSNEQRSLAAAASDQIRAIVDAAEQAAAQIRAEAEEEAMRIRTEAEEEATGIRGQARGDVRQLLESIRTGLSRMRADIELLEEKLTSVGPVDTAATPADEVPADRQPARAAVSTEPTAAPSASDSDLEGARLVALNMALDGADRDQVDRYLSENFELSDRQALLDEVYAAAGG